MFTIGNNELNRLPEIITEGTIIEHLHEDGLWEEAIIRYGTDAKTGEKSSTLGLYTLRNGKYFLASVSGKLIPRANLRIKVDAPSMQ